MDGAQLDDGLQTKVETQSEHRSVIGRCRCGVNFVVYKCVYRSIEYTLIRYTLLCILLCVLYCAFCCLLFYSVTLEGDWPMPSNPPLSPSAYLIALNTAVPQLWALAAVAKWWLCGSTSNQRRKEMCLLAKRFSGALEARNGFIIPLCWLLSDLQHLFNVNLNSTRSSWMYGGILCRLLWSTHMSDVRFSLSGLCCISKALSTQGHRTPHSLIGEHASTHPLYSNVLCFTLVNSSFCPRNVLGFSSGWAAGEGGGWYIWIVSFHFNPTPPRSISETSLEECHGTRCPLQGSYDVHSSPNGIRRIVTPPLFNLITLTHLGCQDPPLKST